MNLSEKEYSMEYEFNSPYLFCCSDAESFTMSEVLSLANQEEQNLWDNSQLKYTEPFGYPLLRSAISNSMHENMQADNILCFAGAEEGVYWVVYTLFTSGNIWFVLNEVYRYLEKPSALWVNPAADIYDRALSLGVMSKAFEMPELRVGWIVCQDQSLLHNIKRMKDYTSICNRAPSEILSLITLQNKNYFLDRNNQIVDHNLALLEQFFLQNPGKFQCVKPQEGCVGLVNYLADNLSIHSVSSL